MELYDLGVTPITSRSVLPAMSTTSDRVLLYRHPCGNELLHATQLRRPVVHAGSEADWCQGTRIRPGFSHVEQLSPQPAFERSTTFRKPAGVTRKMPLASTRIKVTSIPRAISTSSSPSMRRKSRKEHIHHTMESMALHSQYRVALPWSLASPMSTFQLLTL